MLCSQIAAAGKSPQRCSVRGAEDKWGGGLSRYISQNARHNESEMSSRFFSKVAKMQEITLWTLSKPSPPLVSFFFITCDFILFDSQSERGAWDLRGLSSQRAKRVFGRGAVGFGNPNAGNSWGYKPVESSRL